MEFKRYLGKKIQNPFYPIFNITLIEEVMNFKEWNISGLWWNKKKVVC